MIFLTTCLTWYFGIMSVLLSHAKSRFIAVFCLAIFTLLYGGGLDYENYQTIVSRLDFNNVNPERISLYIYAFAFGDLTTEILKIISLPIFFLAVDVYARRRMNFNIYQRTLTHLYMFMIPLGYIAALTVFRQTLALSLILLLFSSRFLMSQIIFMSSALVHHLSFPLAYVAIKFKVYFGVVWLFMLAFSLIVIDKLGIYNSFKKLDFSGSYSYFLFFVALLFISFTFLNIKGNLNFLINLIAVLLISLGVITNLIPADIVTRSGNYFIIPFVLSLVQFVSSLSYKSNRSIILGMSMIICVITPIFIFDRPEYQIKVLGE